MQFEGKQPLGVVYITSMTRPDSAVALALLYGFQGKREARIGAVTINGAGLGAAIFCDIVQRFYTPGPLRNANQTLLPGLAASAPLPPDPPLVKTAVEHKEYARSIQRISDTSLPEAVIRNGVIFNAEVVMILSARATDLAKSLDLQGVKDLYKERVKMLLVVDSGEPQDVPAIRKILAEFPSPIVFCGKEVGDALPFFGAAIDTGFAWATTGNPVADAYHAFRPGIYDFPSYDLAATLQAVHPDKGYFTLSTPGSITVADDGRLAFAVGNGNVRAMGLDPAQKDKILQTLIEVATAKIPGPQQRVKKP